MSVEIICGRSKSGKSKYIYDKIVALSKQGEEVILIVPEQFSHIAEKKLLLSVDAIVDNKLEVFSFAHLAASARKLLGLAEASYITPVSKALVARKVIEEANLSFYGKAAAKQGFASLAVSTIEEMKKYMIYPDDLNNIAMSTDNEILRMKLSDIQNLYRLYDEKMSEIYADCRDNLEILAQLLRESGVFRNKYIFFDEFDSFVPQEIDVIASLASSCKGVGISLCIDRNEKNSTLFMPANDTLKKLVKNIKEKFVYTFTDKGSFSSNELSHLEKNLFGFPSRAYDGKSEDIRIYSMNTPLSEAEMCAANIRELTRQGYSYRDIGVICSDIEAYRNHIERVFDRSGIEYFTDAKNDIINHHLIRFVLGILEIYLEEYSYESVFGFLKASFVDAGYGEISFLESFIKKTRIRRKGWLEDDRWNSILEANYPGNDSLKESLSEIRRKYILPLAAMHEEIKGRNTVKSNALVLYRYIESIGMPETIRAYINKFTESGETRLAKEYEKLWEIIVDTLDELVIVSGKDKVSPAIFYELLVTAFSQHKVGFIPLAIDRVTVGNTERTRLDGIKVLFVLGANETVFPVAPKIDGILGDADKESMLVCGKEFSTTSSAAAYYSQYCSYKVLTMPSEKLIISYCRLGNDFKTQRKSYIVDRVAKMFSIKEHTEENDFATFKLHSPDVAGEFLCETLAKGTANNESEGIWKAVYDYFLENTDFISIAENYRDCDNIFRSVSENNLKELVPMLSHTSVSKVERYMACKYAYFIDYVLHLQTPKDEAVDALDIGNISHKALEIISREFASDREKLISADEDAVLNRICEVIDREYAKFNSMTEDVSARDEYTIKRLVNSVYLCYKIVRKQILNSRFEPLGYEIEFSENSPMGPIELKTGDGRDVILTGKIDRADVYRTEDAAYVRVIDYKTGSKEFKLDEVFYGLNVQLMVYLNKLVSVDGKNDYGGALYFPVSDLVSEVDVRLEEDEAYAKLEEKLKLKGLIPWDEKLLGGYDEKLASSLSRSQKAKRVSLEGFETIDKYLRKKLGDICGDILNGDFEISPYLKNGFSPCKYCKYGAICRFDSEDINSKCRMYKSMTNYDEILGEMEAVTNVDK